MKGQMEYAQRNGGNKLRFMSFEIEFICQLNVSSFLIVSFDLFNRL